MERLDFFCREGSGYGLVRYLDTVTGKDVHQIDAHHGDTWRIGRGNTWTEVARDLMKKIYDIALPGPNLH